MDVPHNPSVHRNSGPHPRYWLSGAEAQSCLLGKFSPFFLHVTVALLSRLQVCLQLSFTSVPSVTGLEIQTKRSGEKKEEQELQ